MRKIVLTTLCVIASAASAQQPRFVLNAANGGQWIDQCERPSTKTEGNVRVAACVSFVTGARSTSYFDEQAPRCRDNLQHAPPGALLDVSFSFARQYPEKPINEIMALTMSVAKGLSCRD